MAAFFFSICLPYAEQCHIYLQSEVKLTHLMGFLGAAIDPELGKKLYADPGLIICGALNPLGRADPVPGGYRVSGQWPFASGCHNSQYFWGQCIVYDGHERARDEKGDVVLREVIVPASQWEIVDTWHVAGLRGSGSCDVRIDDVFVPDDHITAVNQGRPRETGPLFRLPPYSRLAYNKTGVATGIARNALDAFIRLASEKQPRLSAKLLRERPSVQRDVAEAEVALRSARAWLFEAVDELWHCSLDGRDVTAEQRALMQLACSNAARASVRAVEIVHSAAGVTANFTSSPLERCFRDVHVVPQHITVSPQWIEAGGRVLLGLDSETFFL